MDVELAILCHAVEEIMHSQVQVGGHVKGQMSFDTYTNRNYHCISDEIYESVKIISVF